MDQHITKQSHSIYSLHSENICCLLNIGKESNTLFSQLNLLGDMLEIAGAFPFLFCDEFFGITNVLNTSKHADFWFSLMKKQYYNI